MKNKIKVIYFILLVIIIAIAVTTVSLYAKWQNNKEPVYKNSLSAGLVNTASSSAKKESENKTCDKIIAYKNIKDITDWQLYKSNKLGIQFKYPKELFYISESEVEGRIYLFFVENGCESDKVRIDLDIFSCTDDYKDVQGRECRFKNIQSLKDLCKDELVYGEDGTVCKLENRNGNDIIFKNRFETSEGVFAFVTSAIIKNNTNKNYKWLELEVQLPGVDKNIGKYWDDEKAYTVAKNESEKIINKKGLSKNDLNFLNIFEYILDSIEFEN